MMMCMLVSEKEILTPDCVLVSQIVHRKCADAMPILGFYYK